MLWHEDINKMAVYGRYCGRYNPGKIFTYFQKEKAVLISAVLGNKVVSSNRVLIRFTSGSYKPDVFSKKGFIAELSSSSSIVPSLYKKNKKTMCIYFAEILIPSKYYLIGSSSGSILIVRWTLIGCAIFFAAGVVIFLWFWLVLLQNYFKIRKLN